jgi:hypothetical protein
MATFNVGQTVMAVRSEQWCITGGKQYVVVHVEPEHVAENGFRFPEYVTVTDDNGDNTQFHTYRFRAIE